MDKLRRLAAYIADNLEDVVDHAGTVLLSVLLLVAFVAAVLALLVAIKLLFWLLLL